MPPIKKPSKKPTVPATPLLYPEVEIWYCFTPDSSKGRSNGIGPITGAQAKELLGWETEDEYKIRAEAEAKGDVTKSSKKFTGFGGDYILEDTHGRKVKCWRNEGNRRFKQRHALKLAQDILYKRWRLNLETIIISNTGRVQSGQHRLIALILACELWAKDSRWRTYWPTEPTIESLVAFGGSEDPDVIQTLDNVCPRSLADIFYTSPAFAKLKPNERNDCSRYLDHAIDLLWKRTGASTKQNKYQTHSTSMEFFERHGRIEEAVEFCFQHNKDRQISVLNLFAGHAACMLYLMGCCTSDAAKYQGNPSEKSLDWRYWDKAKEFWKLLANRDDSLSPVRTAIGSLVDVDTGAGGGRQTEKLAILSKAWIAYLKGHITKEDLELDYGVDGNGRTVLSENPTVGGIDRGSRVRTATEEEPTPEEIAMRAAEERQKRMGKPEPPKTPVSPSRNVVTPSSNGEFVISQTPKKRVTK